MVPSYRKRIDSGNESGRLGDFLRYGAFFRCGLRPVWFMEHFALPWLRPSIEKVVLSTPLRPEKELQLVSADDIGRIAAETFTIPRKFVGKEIDIVGDNLTLGEIGEEISRVLSRPVRYDHVPRSRLEKAVGRDCEPMFPWLDEHGYDADIRLAQSRFHRFEISLTPFRKYLNRSRLELEQAARVRRERKHAHPLPCPASPKNPAQRT